MTSPFASRLTFFVLICSALFAANVFAANNPVPFVNQPLVPASVAPGGNNFQLTVNGTGFVSGSTVNWNGSPRATTFVNQGQLTATILSTDIASASTASITVTSPAPGGGTSSVAFLPVRNPSNFVSLNTSTVNLTTYPDVLGTGDFNNDGNQDLAVDSYDPSTQSRNLSIMLGNGDGTFTQGAAYAVQNVNGWYVTADLNHDGNLDLAFDAEISNQTVFVVMLGNGDGTFQAPITVLPTTIPIPQFADFNQDGKIDAAYGDGNGYCILLGNGDGTFQQPNCVQVSGGNFGWVTAGDFNRDGKLDLALSDSLGNNQGFVAIALGNGDGTFQLPQNYPNLGDFYYFLSADFNGDGYLDFVTETQGQLTSPVTTLFGNGQGAFREGPNVPAPYARGNISIADMNGDGYLDIIGTTNYLSAATIWSSLGNGDGTFQKYSVFGGGSPDSFAVADFNNDGKMDVAVANYSPTTVTVLLQDNGTVLNFSPDRLAFPLQPINTVSPPRAITITNNGTAAVTFGTISTTTNFSELNNCKTVQPGKSCKLAVYFTPTLSGDLLGALSLSDNAGGSPQLISLSGIATEVQITPTSLDFGDQTVDTLSKPQDVLLTNNGKGELQIKEIEIRGSDPRDFYQVNACPSSLPTGKSCTISVIFRPTATGARSAVLGIADNGGGSPQTVTLSGTGT